MLEAGRYDEADAMSNRITDALADWLTKTGAESGGYRQGKAMLAAMGQPIGPPRPPTLPVAEEDIAELRVIFENLGWVSST